MSRREDEHRGEIPKDSIRELIEAARAGSQEAMGELLQRCRKYLLLVAGRELSPRVRVKEAASDVVQETCVDAQQNLLAFAGETRQELLAWLRRILLHHVAEAHRRYTGTQKRDLAAELVRIEASGDGWQMHAARQVASPSTSAMAREKREQILQIMDSLGEDDRQVILLHHRRKLPFSEIAKEMGRSEAAVRKLWTRAVRRLEAKAAEAE